MVVLFIDTATSLLSTGYFQEQEHLVKTELYWEEKYTTDKSKVNVLEH